MNSPDDDAANAGFDSVYERIDVDDAEQLLQALSPWSSRWGRDKWLFRGQRDAEWKLSPSAMRPNAFGAGSKPHDFVSRANYEARALDDFLNACERSSLPIPEDSQWLRSPMLADVAMGALPARLQSFVTSLAHYLQFWTTPPAANGAWWLEVIESAREAALVDQTAINFPPPIHRSLYALAQHHQVSTRLLDWSRSSMVAAYFACCKTARMRYENEPTVPGRCAVFAMREKTTWPIFNDAQYDPDGPRLEQVTAPYSCNPNLRAQAGVFTLVTYGTPDRFPDPIPSIEQILEERFRTNYSGYRLITERPLLIKFTLPSSECPRALRLLAQANVHSGTIYPSYDGVVTSIEERKWHD